MKKLYWRTKGISRTALILIALISLAGLVGVEHLQVQRRQPEYGRKTKAAELARDAMEIIKQERLKRGLVIDPNVDAAGTGLIGALLSPVTSATASLEAKQTSVNPNFAAVAVELLLKAGVHEGDTVAVACTGSFPAMNVCMYAAVHTLNLKPIIVTSVASSQFGANESEYLWVDMEKVLHDADPDRFPFRSVAASLGGADDKAAGLSERGREMLRTAVERNGIQLLESKNYTDSISKHMAVYTSRAGDLPIKAYINVGGGTSSTGTRLGKRTFQPGLNLRKLPKVQYTDSVMTRFLEQGVPVLHFMQIEELARRYGFAEAPKEMPQVGQGEVFYRDEYNSWLVTGVLVAILASLYAFVRSEVGYRILQTQPRGGGDVFHEPMV
jgi:poly-gamma-glutamate system protein